MKILFLKYLTSILILNSSVKTVSKNEALALNKEYSKEILSIRIATYIRQAFQILVSGIAEEKFKRGYRAFSLERKSSLLTISKACGF
jgi:hypothetical protein